MVKVLCYSGTAVAQWLRCCATVGPRWHSGEGAVLQWDRGGTVVKVLCYSGTAVAQWLRCCATVGPRWHSG